MKNSKGEVERLPPSMRQLSFLGGALVAVLAGLGQVSNKLIAPDIIKASVEEAAKYTDLRLADHIRYPLHSGAVPRETFEEFRRTLEAAFEGMATKERQEVILDRQKEIDSRLRDVERAVGGH